MESFYGGKQGTSFVIKASFPWLSVEDATKFCWSSQNVANYSVNEENDLYEKGYPKKGELQSNWKKRLKEHHLTLKECFEDANYQDVWFYEYGLIDCPNPHYEHHGEIYKRIYRPTETETTISSNLEYLGRMAGPEGPAPFLKFDTLDEVAKKAKKNEEDIVTKLSNFGFYDNNNQWHSSLLSAEDSSNLLTLKTYEDKDGNFDWYVPGVKLDENGNVTFNEDGKPIDPVSPSFNYINIQDLQEITDPSKRNQCYVGLKIPYTVQDWEVNRVPYTEDLSTEGSSLKGFPFYHKNTISFPEGNPAPAIMEEKIISYSEFRKNQLNKSMKKCYDKEKFFSEAVNSFGYNQITENSIYLAGKSDILKGWILAEDSSITDDTRIIVQKIKYPEAIITNSNQLLSKNERAEWFFAGYENSIQKIAYSDDFSGAQYLLVLYNNPKARPLVVNPTDSAPEGWRKKEGLYWKEVGPISEKYNFAEIVKIGNYSKDKNNIDDYLHQTNKLGEIIKPSYKDIVDLLNSTLESKPIIVTDPATLSDDDLKTLILSCHLKPNDEDQTHFFVYTGDRTSESSENGDKTPESSESGKWLWIGSIQGGGDHTEVKIDESASIIDIKTFESLKLEGNVSSHFPHYGDPVPTEKGM